MRNKAAEKAKSVGHHGHGGSNSGPVSPVSQTTSVITHGSVASVPSHLHNQHGQHLLSSHDSPLQRPGSYSINGILGIPQTDPNGNIKRKRDDQGTIHSSFYIIWNNKLCSLSKLLEKFLIFKIFFIHSKIMYQKWLKNS